MRMTSRKYSHGTCLPWTTECVEKSIEIKDQTFTRSGCTKEFKNTYESKEGPARSFCALQTKNGNSMSCLKPKFWKNNIASMSESPSFYPKEIVASLPEKRLVILERDELNLAKVATYDENETKRSSLIDNHQQISTRRNTQKLPPLSEMPICYSISPLPKSSKIMTPFPVASLKLVTLSQFKKPLWNPQGIRLHPISMRPIKKTLSEANSPLVFCDTEKTFSSNTQATNTEDTRNDSNLRKKSTAQILPIIENPREKVHRKSFINREKNTQIGVINIRGNLQRSSEQLLNISMEPKKIVKISNSETNIKNFKKTILLTGVISDNLNKNKPSQSFLIHRNLCNGAVSKSQDEKMNNLYDKMSVVKKESIFLQPKIKSKYFEPKFVVAEPIYILPQLDEIL